MKKKFLAGLAAGVFMFGMVSISNATVLNFEGLTTSQVQNITTNNQGYGGFTWDAGWYLYNDNFYNTPAHSGDYGIVNNFGTNPLGLSIASSNTFDFNGAWISGWHFNAPSQVKAQGFDNLGNLVAETNWMAVTVGVNTYLASSFNNVTRVDFLGGGYFTIDDFTYNNESAPVPEPTTMLLFGTGLAGLLGIRINRKKKT